MSLSPAPAPRLFDLAPFRTRTLLLFIVAGAALLLSGFVVRQSGLPIWGGTQIFLSMVAVPVGLKGTTTSCAGARQ